MFYLENNLASGAFTPERLQVIEVLATRAAISIENARLYANLEKRVEERTASLARANLLLEREMTERKQAEQELIQQHRATAMLEERERLARELHDSLSQVLGFVNLQAQAARELFSGGHADQGDETIARLVRVVQDAQVDVWEYILGVKTAVALEHGFIPTLRQYLEQFERDHAIHIDLTLPGELTDEAFEYPVQIQLLRIIQEALNNIRKHAGVRAARVRFEVQPDLLQVSIEDDGIGFSLPAEGADSSSGILTGQHFGLRVMRERAAEVGGRLQVRSAPGQGTHIIVRLPCRF
jgi:signal transduction histidine kinase